MNQFHRRRRQPTEPCDCLRPLIRVLGLITSIVICGVGVDIYLHRYIAGLYILIISVVILFLEIKWVVTLFVQLLLSNDEDSMCVRCWNIMRICGGWRLAPPYIAIGTALIMWPHNLWLSYVAGCLIIMLAVLRLCTIFRFSNNSKEEELLSQCDFEKIEGCLDIAEEISPNLEDEEPIDDIC